MKTFKEYFLEENTYTHTSKTTYDYILREKYVCDYIINCLWPLAKKEISYEFDFGPAMQLNKPKPGELYGWVYAPDGISKSATLHFEGNKLTVYPDEERGKKGGYGGGYKWKSIPKNKYTNTPLTLKISIEDGE